MNDNAWHWARLDRKGIALVQETESALGADFVLAYGTGGPVADAAILAGLAPVALNESQLASACRASNRNSASSRWRTREPTDTRLRRTVELV